MLVVLLLSVAPADPKTIAQRSDLHILKPSLPTIIPSNARPSVLIEHLKCMSWTASQISVRDMFVDSGVSAFIPNSGAWAQVYVATVVTVWWHLRQSDVSEVRMTYMAGVIVGLDGATLVDSASGKVWLHTAVALLRCLWTILTLR